jgi:hypothetical protein
MHCIYIKDLNIVKILMQENDQKVKFLDYYVLALYVLCTLHQQCHIRDWLTHSRTRH